MVERPDPISRGSSRKLLSSDVGVSSITARKGCDYPDRSEMMEIVVERENMLEAYKRVVGNKGCAGVDGMTVDDLRAYLNDGHWERIKLQLLEGKYKPQPVLEVEIPKPDGGVRKLGIPVVVDRLIGQALYQVMEPIFEPNFSDASFGFRRGRSAHQALEKAQMYVKEGYRWVVDIDLEKFFDRVNHDILMSLIARRIQDKRMLGLLRRYLQAGIMIDGLETTRDEGTPQGSPLSPLLSNIILDVMDKELERRGHQFARYADDCNIYVKSERAGERVMKSISRFLEKRLKLKINVTKSAVGRPWKLKFLGHTMTRDRNPRLRVAPRSEQRLKNKLREIFRKGRGRNIERVIKELNTILIGWMNYFKLTQVKSVFEQLDEWIRRKLRCNIWRQWKNRNTRCRNLIKRGLDKQRAKDSSNNGRGPWWNAGASHMNAAYKKSDFQELGLVSLLDKFETIRKQS